MNSSKKTRKKKNIPRSTSEMSREVLVETLKKKKECNARALAIVERLCDEVAADADWLLSNLVHINQSHFDDVITERAIQKICGYPLCETKLENIPAKKYHISSRENKVYDITERKNFCSNKCYKAGTYLKSQLLTSPLWFRDKEIIPEFKLMNVDAPSPIGEEVVFLPEMEELKRDVMAEKRSAGKAEKLAEKLADLKLGKGAKASDRGEEEERSPRRTGGRETEEEAKRSEEDAKTPEEDAKRPEEDAKRSEEDAKRPEEDAKRPEEDVKRPEEDVKRTEVVKEAAPVVDPVKKVEQCVHEWFTFDTVLFLYGEEKVKDMLKDRAEEAKEILRTKPLVAGYSDKIDRMLSFYSLLDHQLESEGVKKNLKPLPDYAAIKEDGKRLELKVRAYYSGQLEVGEAEPVAEKSDDGDIYLPFVDAHEQNALRVKILLDRFNKVIPEVIRTFTTANCFEMSELRRLVDHFKLSAHNITFRPGEWYLVGFIVVKLLSVKNKQLESLLKSETAKKHITLVLMNYGLPQDYLENMLEWLMNPETLVHKLK